MGTHSGSEVLDTIGKEEWALHFRGVSIGQNDSKVADVCLTNTGMDEDGVCAAIVDAGRDILGPAKHLSLVNAAICDAWLPCKDAYEANQLFVQDVAANKQTPDNKTVVLSRLLESCEGLTGMPSLKFHVAGTGGNTQMLVIPYQGYVSKNNGTCGLGLGVSDAVTDKGNPIWILGASIFYQYHVEFNLERDPHTLSFTHIDEVNLCKPCERDEFPNGAFFQPHREKTLQPPPNGVRDLISRHN